MRRPVSLVACVASLAGAGLLLAGCGSEGVKTATPATVIGTVPTQTQTTPTTPNLPEGHPVVGKTIFTGSAGCFGCHTLSDANAHGTVGPNLDQAKPDLALVIDRVTNGKGGMPSFKGKLTPQQIADVAAYVAQATH